MTPTRFLVIVASVAMLTGCGSQRDEVPGNIHPGSIEDVDGRSGGFGNSNPDQLSEVGVIPVTGFVPPTIPVIKAPKVISFWVYPRKSRDGNSWRDGFWIHAATEPFSWGMEEAMNADRIKLGSLLNMRVDEAGNVMVDQTKNIAPPPNDLNNMKTLGKNMPWKEGEKNETKTKTTIVYDSGQAVALPTRTGVQPSLVGPNNAVNVNEVERALKEADQRMRELQKSSGNNPATQSVPSGK